jgi:small-conductance mechanosensitive channel
MTSALFTLMIEYKLLLTLLTVVVILAAKYALVKLKKMRAKNKGIDRSDLANTFKNLMNFILIILLLNFCSNELQKFAFSIAAFTVAIVLATREFIQCLIGFVYLLSTRPFRVGDWVQIGSHCGEIKCHRLGKIDHS